MVRDLNLNAMAHFEAVARLGGVSRAAEELKVSASAISQQIKALEQQMGVRLFQREKRRLTLTIEGERLFQTTRQAFQSIRDVRTAIVHQRDSYSLSIRVSPSFGVRWLAPRLSEFTRAHPTWQLRVDATPSFSEFDTELIDLDLRYGEGGWAGLHSECVVHDFILPMCSPAYLQELAQISDDPREQMRQARLIDSVKSYFRWDYWLPRNGIVLQTPEYSYRFDRSSMAVQLAKDGVGVILESTSLAFEELRTGQLVPLSNVFNVVEFSAYWLVCPPRHLHRRAVVEFANWIRKVGKRETELARGFLQGQGFTIIPEQRSNFGATEQVPSDET